MEPTADTAGRDGVVTVAVVDDHPVILTALATALTELAPRLQVTSLVAGVAELPLSGPAASVVLLDLRLPDGSDPVDNVRRLREWGSRVVVYTSEERPVPIRRVIDAGAAGLVLKVDPLPSLASTIQRVHEGEIVVTSPVAEALLADAARVPVLSRQQRSCLAALADGMSYAAAARHLGVAVPTLRAHLRRAVERYRDSGQDPENTHGLVRLARDDGNL